MRSSSEAESKKKKKRKKKKLKVDGKDKHEVRGQWFFEEKAGHKFIYLPVSFSRYLFFSTYIYLHTLRHVESRSMTSLLCLYIYIHIYLFVSHQFVRRLDTVIYYYSDILGSPSRESSTISPPRPSGPRPSFPAGSLVMFFA